MIESFAPRSAPDASEAYTVLTLLFSKKMLIKLEHATIYQTLRPLALEVNMGPKTKNRKVIGKVALTGIVSINTQPSALRHHKQREERPTSLRDSSNGLLVASHEGFERRASYVADNKRGQVYVVQRLSDPRNQAEVISRSEAISSEKSKALEFLRTIGVASEMGRLTERFGG